MASSCGRRTRAAELVVVMVAGALVWPVAPAGAHPILQDVMRIDIAPRRVSIRVTASVQEIRIAAAAAGHGDVPWVEAIRRHGDYLLRNLELDADGHPLRGALAPSAPFDVAANAGRAADSTSPITYVIDYALAAGGDDRRPGGAPAVAQLVVRQRTLLDAGLALGGPWEVTYLVSVSRRGHAGVDPRLLTAAEPLTLDGASSADGLDDGASSADGGDDGASSARGDVDIVVGGAGGAPSTRAQLRLAWAYLRQGLAHILRGTDHLLFVAALVLAAATLRDLVKVVVAFTVAHATTLTLCALRLLRLPAAIVEPLIAASIVVVALQNLIAPTASRRAPRLMVAFSFGLLHGCGFASGALQAMRDLPAAGIGLAVGAFSLGVEIGHQVVVIPTFMLLNRIREHASARAFARLQRWGSAAIAIAGGIYLLAALRR